MGVVTENVTWANGSAGGTALSAANLNNFRKNLFDEFNGNIENANLKSTAAIALSKLASGSSAQIIVANASGVPTYVTMSGDATISNTGVVTVSATAASVSLDDAYNVDSAIDVDTSAVTLTVSDTDNNQSLVCVQNDTTNNPGNVEFENAGTGQDLFLDQNGNGIALYIDSESTTANGLDIEGNTFTTGIIINVDNANALTTGSIASLLSGSTSTGTRSLLIVNNTNASATGTTNVSLTQASTGAGLAIACSGNGTHVLMTGDPTVSSPTDGGLWFDGTNLRFRNGTNTEFLGKALYDSGWTQITSVDGDNTFSWTSLGRLPFHITTYFSTSNSGDGANVNYLGSSGGVTSAAATMECGIHSLSAAGCKIRL